MASGACSVGFSHLPPEMKKMIFANLDKETRKTTRSVSHEWKEVADSFMKFNVVLSDETFASVKVMDSDFPIHSLVVQNFNESVLNKSYTRSGLSKNVQEIVLGPGISFPGDSRRLPHPPHTVTRTQPSQIDLHFNSTGISERNVKIVLNCNPQIQSLKVTGSAFKGMDVMSQPQLSGIKLEYLTHLEINYGHFPWIQKMPKHSIDPYVALLKNSYPSLKTLKYSSTAFKAEMKLYISLMQCIANHSETLKHVEIFHSTVYSLPHRNESRNGFPSKKYDELKAKLQQVRLDFLMIDLVKCGPNFGHRWKDLESAFMRSQTTIRTLKVIVNGRSTSDWDMKGVLLAIGKTVTDLELYLGCYCDSVFDCSLLSHCCQLRRVNIQVIRPIYGVLLGSPLGSKMFRSIEALPTSIQKLTLSHMIHDDDAEWISRNMIDLEEITFVYLLHVADEDSINQQFLRLMALPKFKAFRVTYYYCEKLGILALAVPGILNMSNGVDTNIVINREQLEMTPEVIDVLKALGFKD